MEQVRRRGYIAGIVTQRLCDRLAATLDAVGADDTLMRVYHDGCTAQDSEHPQRLSRARHVYVTVAMLLAAQLGGQPCEDACVAARDMETAIARCDRCAAESSCARLLQQCDPSASYQ